MIIQRFTGDQGTLEATLTIRTNPDDANSYAELLALHDELKLRANVQTEGSIITAPAPEDIPPIPPEG
jgi:hypothetical protein